jgi:small nuclear ribonucleoprotein (snRNP)-like protein
MELKIDEIYTFKLNSGEELVGKVVQVDLPNILLQDPVSIGPAPQGGLGLVPSMFTVNPHSKVRLNTQNVSLIGETDESVRAKYIEATTGLKVPEKKVILG